MCVWGNKEEYSDMDLGCKNKHNSSIVFQGSSLPSEILDLVICHINSGKKPQQNHICIR